MKIEILKDTLFKDISCIDHGFFTKQGGVSKGAYFSLNCSYHRDIREDVKENRRRAMIAIGRPPGALVTFEDMHSNKAIIVDEPWDDDQKVNADAMVTTNKNVVLGALGADCPIVLFAEEHSNVIGIAHAGWRGARAGIIESTVEKILSLCSRVNNVVATIGPCIAQESYEIGPEVYELFTSDNRNNEIYFKPSDKAKHFMFDLRHYISDKLNGLGINQVSNLEIDTYKNEDQFFSRRRSYHNGEQEYGCNMGFICLK